MVEFDISSAHELGHRLALKRMTLVMVISIIIISFIIIFSDYHNRHPIILWALNLTGAFASILGIIAVWRHGIGGNHGKSYLFLTLGLISWFSADITLTYYYYSFGIEEQKLVSFTYFLCAAGYIFISLHLILIVKDLGERIRFKTFIIPVFATLALILYETITMLSSESSWSRDIGAFAVTIAYPILDMSLMIPSIIILLHVRKDYEHSIPWLLSSLSLLINAIADDGYVHDFVSGNSQNFWVWDLFYIADFIIMAGALYWYNRYHIARTVFLRRNI